MEPDRLVVIGHGLGGYLALRTALEGIDAGNPSEAAACAPAAAVCGAVALSPLSPGGCAGLPVGPEAREVEGWAVRWAGGALPGPLRQSGSALADIASALLCACCRLLLCLAPPRAGLPLSNPGGA